MNLRLLVGLSLLTASLKSMEMTTDTPLHRAARSGDLNTCVELLVQPTWLTETMIQKGQFPAEAFASIQAGKNPFENKHAMREMSLFAVMSNKFMQHQMARARVQLTTLDAELLTPYDCAAKAQANANLLAILNPDGLHQQIAHKIMAIIAETLGASGKVGIAMVPQAAANDGPVFMPGEQINLAGQNLVCTEVKKLTKTHETE